MLIFALIFLISFMQIDALTQTKIYVHYRKADCTGAAPAKCLQIKFEEKSDWMNHFGGIEGFNYEEGYAYQLLVEKEIIDNPPADGSSIKYILKEIISKNRPIVKLNIAARYTDCEDTKIFKCLLVKEEGENEWKPFYSGIRGFDYTEGHEYEIEAEKILVSNPDEQGYIFEYELKNIISDKPVMNISVTDKKFLSEDKFTIERMRIEDKLKKIKDKKFNLKFDTENSMVSGNDGCNSFSGKAEINGNQINFGPFMKTRMYCEKVITDKHFYKLIGETDRFKIKGDKLQFFGMGSLLIELLKAD